MSDYYEVKINLGTDWHGKTIRKSFYSKKSKADARRKAEKYRAQYEFNLLCGGDEARKRVFFRDWAIQCLESSKKPFVKGNTYHNTYLQPVQDRLIPYFGDAPLDKILPIHVQEYVNKMKSQYKPETIKKDFTVFAFIMQNAVENGLCRQNPAGKSIRLPKVERADKQALTQEQYDVVYEMAKREPNGLSIMLMMETGVSRSELLGVTWRDLDLENGILHINQGLVSYVDADRGWVTESDGLKNAYRRRAIPIVEPELLKRLREKPRRIKLKRKTPYGEDFYVDTEQVFHSPEGFPYQPNNWNNRVFLPFMRKVLEAHPEYPELSAHELRHTRATLWIAQGVSPMMAARLLGHSDTKMLMKIYDHTDVETLRRVLTDTRKNA